MKQSLFILLLFVNINLFSQNKFEMSLGGGANVFLIPNSLIAKENTENVVASQFSFNLSYEIIYNISIGTGAESATHKWKEVNMKDNLFYVFGDYYTDALKTYKLYNYPIYLQYEYKKLNKLLPYIKVGYSFTNLKLEKSEFLKASPTDKLDFFFDDYISYEHKDDQISIEDMSNIFMNLGIKYKLTDKFLLGLDVGVKRYHFYWYSKERTNYSPESNLVISYKF